MNRDEEFFASCGFCGAVFPYDPSSEDKRCPKCGREPQDDYKLLEGASCHSCGGAVYWNPKKAGMDDIWGRFRCWNCGILEKRLVYCEDGDKESIIFIPFSDLEGKDIDCSDDEMPF